MKKLVKSLFFGLVVAFIVMIIAVVAAPVFVRQEQVKSFIESKIKLPRNSKMELGGDINFGIFPLTYIKIPTVKILNPDGDDKTFENFSLSFNPMNLLGKSISFDNSFKLGENEYEGNIYIDDYDNYMRTGNSPVQLNMEKPLPIKIKGNLAHEKDNYSLNDFKISHKQTLAIGNLKVTTLASEGQQVDLDTEITSENIEDIRRLIQFGKNEEDFNLFSGSAKVKLNLTTKGDTAEALKANLNGEGTASINDAAVYGLDLNELIGAPQETELTKDEDKKIDINEADSDFKITNGLVNIQQVNAANQLASISGQGLVDITKSALKVALDINTDISSAKVNIPLVVYGTFDKVKFAPRVGDAIINNIDSIVDTSKIQLKDIKIDLGKGSVSEKVEKLKDIGKSFGLDLEKVSKGLVKEIREPEQPAVPQAPAAPASVPASMQPGQLEQPQQPQQPNQ